MPINELSLAIVGIDYPNRRGPTRRFELALCSPGEAVILRPEPTNPVDPQAVAVFSVRDVQLGYLSAERCGWIGAMIRNGREIRAVFQGFTGSNAFIRVAFDGADPRLPPPPVASQAAADDDGFWPDDLPPDD